MEDFPLNNLTVEPTEDGLFIAYVVGDYRNCAFGETPDEALDNLREKAAYYTASFTDSDYYDAWA
ncbi:unknown [Prevotella sp. CAG:755]|nr:unknown [Prevotella sp. CAG:755]